jgi:hypothetical protein
MAQPQQYRMLRKVIQHLDVMPLQVLLDATIVAVNLTENLEYGVKWLFKNSGPDGLEGVGIIGAIAQGARVAAATCIDFEDLFVIEPILWPGATDTALLWVGCDAFAGLIRRNDCCCELN